MPLRIRLILLTLIAILLPDACHAKKANLNYDYTISGHAIAKEGYYLVEVSALVDKKKAANIETVKQCALLGCLYKGFAVDRISQKPILSKTLDDKEEEFVQKLILQDYNTYTSSTYPLQIVKVGKKYRVSSIILVSKDILRKDLESAGIVRKLGL